jgi:hypothetical protein
MSQSTRRLVVTACALSLCLPLTSCSGKTRSPGVVIKAGATQITKAGVEHWMSVIAAESGGAGRPAPQTPDPPHFSRCVAYKRVYDPKPPSDQRPLPISQVRAECRLFYERLKLKAIYFLIDDAWLRGKAGELGVRVTSEQVERQRRLSFPSEAAYRRVLSLEHLSSADMLTRIRLLVLAGGIQQKVEQRAGGSGSPRNTVMSRFGRAFMAQWKAKTSCRAGYVVPVCKQYKRPKRPPVLVPPSVPLAG